MLRELDDLVRPAEILCRRVLPCSTNLNKLDELFDALRPIANPHLADAVMERYHLENLIRQASVEASIVIVRIELARKKTARVDFASESIAHAVRAFHETLSTLIREIELGPPR